MVTKEKGFLKSIELENNPNKVKIIYKTIVDLKNASWCVLLLNP